MSGLTPERLAEIEARANAATPGEWFVVGDTWRDVNQSPYVLAGTDDPHGGKLICDLLVPDTFEAEDDAALWRTWSRPRPTARIGTLRQRTASPAPLSPRRRPMADQNPVRLQYAILPEVPGDAVEWEDGDGGRVHPDDLARAIRAAVDARLRDVVKALSRHQDLCMRTLGVFNASYIGTAILNMLDTAPREPAREQEGNWVLNTTTTRPALEPAQERQEAPAPETHVDKALARLAAAEARAARMEAALQPFASVGQWLFARDIPDETPLVAISGLNGSDGNLTRGHFKAAHVALASDPSALAQAIEDAVDWWHSADCDRSDPSGVMAALRREWGQR